MNMVYLPTTAEYVIRYVVIEEGGNIVTIISCILFVSEDGITV